MWLNLKIFVNKAIIQFKIILTLKIYFQNIPSTFVNTVFNGTSRFCYQIPTQSYDLIVRQICVTQNRQSMEVLV